MQFPRALPPPAADSCDSIFEIELFVSYFRFCTLPLCLFCAVSFFLRALDLLTVDGGGATARYLVLALAGVRFFHIFAGFIWFCGLDYASYSIFF